MDVGDPVLLPDGSLGTLKRLPRSEGSKRPRALVASPQGDIWLHLDELKEVPGETKPEN